MKIETEQLLQDYLDDRLSEETRRAFEERLGQDDELVGRVRAAREVRAVLREETPRLSSDFYARARARFETGTAVSGRRRFRPLSWETAGLAVAAGLVLMLVGPALLRREAPLSDTMLRTEPAQQRAQTESDPKARILGEGSETVPAPAALGDLAAETEPTPPPRTGAMISDLRDHVGKDATAGQESGARSRDADTAVSVTVDVSARSRYANVTEEADESFSRQAARAATDALLKEETEGNRPGEPTPGPATAPFDKGRADDVELRQAEKKKAQPKLAAPSPEPLPQRPSPPPPASPKPVSESEINAEAPAEEPADGLYRSLEIAGATSRRENADRTGFVGVGGMPVPNGVVAAGTIRLVEDRQAWDRLLAGPAGPAILRLGARFDQHRIVLVGAGASAVDCSRFVVRGGPEGYGIERARAPVPTAATSGACALLVPRDDRPVFVVDANDPPR